MARMLAMSATVAFTSALGGIASADPSPTPEPHTSVGTDGVPRMILPATESTAGKTASIPETQDSESGTMRLSDLDGGSGPGRLSGSDLAALEDSLPAGQKASPISPNIIIGTDGRVKITNVDDSPFVQTPFLVLQSPDGTAGYICTGWLFSDYSIATAGHCLYGHGAEDPGWKTNLRAYFGFSGTTYVATCQASLMVVSQEWVDTGSPKHDWGVVQLDCNAGEVLGHFGWRTAASSPGAFAVTGYPGDKYSSTAGYTMWSHNGTISAHSEYLWKYQIDTAGGQSGAPVWRQESTSCGNCSIGIHTYGGWPASNQNAGPRLHAGVRQALDRFAEWVEPPA